MLMLMLYSWLFSTLFLFMNHPLTLGSMLLMQTIIVALMSGLLYMNFWFSYIMFLIMVGGMLIMFMYMTSIASNEKFKMPGKLMTVFFITITIFFVFTSFLMDNFFIPSIQYMTTNFSMNNSWLLSLNKFFNLPNYILSIMLMLYLLLTLIAIVKITGKNMGPLRQK
uniref:NADH-ubiquinone oxidoreductase chain 6 n=1 Tax=Curculionoidea sp. 1 KM-2015 TaxID=1903762 RepID=A0A343A5J3_9CUCU|nr:NADH dehydrogenase subunit 6 [Curculionoidea sp. 1 KM-2015]